MTVEVKTGSEILDGELLTTWTFPSSSGNGTYTTRLADDGKLLCNCKGWTMRRGTAPRHCTHTKKVAALRGATVIARGEFVYLALGAAAAPPAPLPVQDAVVTTDAPPAPMLASAMTDPVRGAAFDARFGGGEWWMEEKLDGHRCTVDVTAGSVVGYSRPRAGGTGALVRPLSPAIVAALAGFPDGVYDGELVAPSGKAWDVTATGSALVFVVFDLLDATSLRQPYVRRRCRLLQILGGLPAGQTAVSTVESLPPTWAAIEAIWARGGEGAILKRGTSRYQPGRRTPDWIKVKATHAATLTLIGFADGKSGPYSALRLRDAAGVETTVKTLGNALLAAITAAPGHYLGKRVVISFQEKTPSGTYRHGIFDHFAGKGE